jgi:hypothetical protein
MPCSRQRAHPRACKVKLTEASRVGELEQLDVMQKLLPLLSADHPEMLLPPVEPRQEHDTRLVEPRRRAEDVPR